MNIPVIALSIVGLLLAVAGIFVQESLFLIAGGVALILFAFVLQEMTKRRA